MKKKWNRKLFVKMMMIVFGSLLCIEGIHLYIDYNDDVEEYKNLVKQVYIHIPYDTIQITNLYENQYSSITDQNFLKDIQKIDDTVRRNNCLIVDKNFNPIALDYYPVDYDYNANLILSKNADEEIIMSFDNDDHELYYQLYDIVYNHVENHNELLKAEVVLADDKEEVFYKTDKFQYLKVGEEIVINNNSQNKQPETYYFTYFNDNYIHINYDWQDETYESAYNYRKSNEMLLKEIVRLREDGKAIHYNNAQHVMAGNHIYYISLDRLGNEGYIIRYEVLYDAITNIKNDLLQSRQSLYMGLIVFGLAVSFVLTTAADKSSKQ